MKFGLGPAHTGLAGRGEYCVCGVVNRLVLKATLILLQVGGSLLVAKHRLALAPRDDELASADVLLQAACRGSGVRAWQRRALGAAQRPAGTGRRPLSATRSRGRPVGLEEQRWGAYGPRSRHVPGPSLCGSHGPAQPRGLSTQGRGRCGWVATRRRSRLRHGAPDGYKRAVEVSESGAISRRLVIDPARSALVETVFRQAVAGSKSDAIARALNDPGWRTPGTRRFAPTTWTGTEVNRMLRDPCYAGVSVIKGEILARGWWPAYVSESSQQRICERLAATRPVTGPQDVFLFAHLARCARCGGAPQSRVGKQPCV